MKMNNGKKFRNKIGMKFEKTKINHNIHSENETFKQTDAQIGVERKTCSLWKRKKNFDYTLLWPIILLKKKQYRNNHNPYGSVSVSLIRNMNYIEQRHRTTIQLLNDMMTHR